MNMATSGVSNLRLKSSGMLFSIPKWSPVGGLGRRGSSRAVGVGVAISRGERCVGPAGCERSTGGVRLVQRWRSRGGILDGVVTFRATAADDVEQEEEVEEEEDTEAGAAASSSSSSSSSQRDHQLSSREIPKISRIGHPKSSRIEQQRQRASGRKLPGTRIRTPSIFSNLVEEWTSFTSVREKGDVRDVVLMSLSFAVLIYISQHLVHAYCSLRHMYFTHH